MKKLLSNLTPLLLVSILSSCAERSQLAPFDVDVEVTEKAQNQLQEIGEEVRLAFYLHHTPNTEGISLGSFEKVIHKNGGICHVEAQKMIPQQTITESPLDPHLLLNVVSTTKRCHFNILSCSIYSGPYPQGQKIKIKCDAIRNRPNCMAPLALK